ncbi:hypothetical protein D9M68_483050 [compost metagenome]
MPQHAHRAFAPVRQRQRHDLPEGAEKLAHPPRHHRQQLALLQQRHVRQHRGALDAHRRRRFARQRQLVVQLAPDLAGGGRADPCIGARLVPAQLAPARQRMRRAGNDADGLGIEQVAAQRRVDALHLGAPDHEIQPPFAQGRQHVFHGALGERQVRLGKRLAEVPDRRGEQVDRHRRRRADRQLARRAVRHHADGGLGAFNLAEDGARVDHQRFAEARRHQAARMPLEQRDAEFAFQLGQPARQCRLRHAEPLRGMAHVAGFVERHQHMQLPDAQALGPVHDGVSGMPKML